MAIKKWLSRMYSVQLWYLRCYHRRGRLGEEAPWLCITGVGSIILVHFFLLSLFLFWDETDREKQQVFGKVMVFEEKFLFRMFCESGISQCYLVVFRSLP